MTFYEPNPAIKQTGAEIDEFAEGSVSEPAPPTSVDPTGEATPAKQDDDDGSADE